MGYHTEFEGSFGFENALTPEQVKYVQKFNETRRMKRNPEGLSCSFCDEVGLPLGREAKFFVSGPGYAGQDRDSSVVDFNKPPADQPGLWCQWTVSDDGTELVWDEGEKFYYYVEWLKWMIENLFIPWGKVLNGEVRWRGEEFNDVGVIIVKDNKVKVKSGW